MTRRKAGQAGAAATLVIIFLPVLLAGVALVIDAGALLTARAQMATAADMGALAAVQDLDYNLLAEGLIVILEEQAVSDAEAWIMANLSHQAFIEPETVVVVVTVLNTEDRGDGGGETSPVNLTCPITGRPVTQPTVCVLVRAVTHLPFLPSLGRVTVEVHADASVVGRP